MKLMNDATDYWFTIEPYVFVGITNKCVLLYNTLDGVTIESDKKEVVKLLREMLREGNSGVALLKSEQYNQIDVNGFIQKLREKFMGDIIDVSLSEEKPVQLLPYFNFPDKYDIYKRHNFSTSKKVLEKLFEISIYMDATTDITKLLVFLQSVPGSPIFNLIGNIGEVQDYNKIISYLNQISSPKNIFYFYKEVIALQSVFENNFSYRISVDFPIDIQQWENVRCIFSNQTLLVEYVFNVSSEEDYRQAERIIELYQIEKYHLNPVYTGKNIRFFEKYVFLSKEDILSTSITIKDFFIRQAINIYDFGKINIMPNGDAYANPNHPVLGNIYTESISDIVYKEIEEGISWFRIRNQAPCNACVLQWLCPSPSNYEIAFGRSNLCHVSN